MIKILSPTLKALILSLLMALTFCFFIGIFWHPPVRVQKFDNNRWFYINRGYPISWAGVSKSNLPVDFPFIKAPFLSTENDEFTKIIDLDIFLPLLFIVMFVSYPIGYVLIRVISKTKILIGFSFIALILTSIYFYFFWFPRL